MEMTEKLPLRDEEYRNVSSRLFDVLDSVGVSEEARSRQKEFTVINEVLSYLDINPADKIWYTNYICGSTSESTTTGGLRSDVDNMTCFHCHVAEQITDGSDDEVDVLIVTDDTTKSGYCKLQYVSNKINKTGRELITDGLRCFIKNCSDVESALGQIHGPAETIVNKTAMGDIMMDEVFALKCHHIPSFANSWIPRITSLNRLSERQITTIKDSGCFFVGVNHPHSQNGPIEWRLSFSLQERELMYSLNPTQHKCYVLLKMIKKDIIHRHVPDSISSYHCKTSLMYAVEQTSCEQWTPDHLLDCTRLCINLLLQWVKERYCPNYFIPEENMFDKFGQSILTRVQLVLENMTEHWYSFVWSLTCDGVGDLLRDVLYGAGPSVLKDKLMETAMARGVLISIERFVLMCRGTNTVINACRDTSITRVLYNLISYQNRIQHTTCVHGHTTEETRKVINDLLPHIQLQIAQCLASIMLTNKDYYGVLFAMFKYYLREGKDCDVISAYLIEASYYLQSGHYRLCENILRECETCFNTNVLYACACEPDLVLTLIDLYIHDVPYGAYLSSCITIIPEMANLVPLALHYEMFRSVNTPLQSLMDIVTFWYDWIVMDSKVYLYFLQYTLYATINKIDLKLEAMKKLGYVTSNPDERLSHREIAMNLLGLIWNEEREHSSAFECFVNSWKLRPHQNAAIWYLLMTCHSVVNKLSRSKDL